MDELLTAMELQSKLSPQMRKIVSHCNRAGHITQRAALDDYGIMALPRRIRDLKELGFEVRTERRKNPGTGQRYVRYFVTAPKAAA